MIQALLAVLIFTPWYLNFVWELIVDDNACGMEYAHILETLVTKSNTCM